MATRGSEQAVVGTHQHPFAGGHLDRHRPSLGADAGVDHAEHDAGRHVLDDPGQRQGTGPHVERRNAMGEIDDGHMRRKITHDRFDDADELVVEPVVTGTRSCRRAS